MAAKTNPAPIPPPFFRQLADGGHPFDYAQDDPEYNRTGQRIRLVRGLLHYLLTPIDTPSKLEWLKKLSKFRDLSKSPHFHLYGTILLAIAILLIKGTGSQTSLFNIFVQRTIVETSASILSPNKSGDGYYLADISNLTAWENGASAVLESGKGGPSEPVFEPTTVQENAVFAHNPADTDYAESVSGKRVGVVEYTVQPGDNLSFIARDYGVSVESIMWANGLRDSNSIREDDILKIPPVSGVIHIVKKGDTINTIAKKYGVEPDIIVTYNDLPQDGKLQVNDELIVPDGKIKSSTGTVATRTPKFSYLPDLGDYFTHPTGGLGRITQWLHGRNGIDVANTYGTPIYAAAAGTVVAARTSGWNGGFGLYIKLSHPNGIDTLYSHLSKTLVVAGQTVQKGQQIGNMGSSGRSTGSHLHFEVHGAKNPLAR